MSDFPVVALDGPGGVGKSSTARALAKRLGYFFLSSGQIYRALAWSALQQGWVPGQALPAGLLDEVHVEVRADGTLAINGESVGAVLNSDEISHATSVLSAQPEVRERSNSVQRETVAGLARSGHFAGVILEGRDIGTVVFPEARHKFFITADTQVRAERRYRELRETDASISLQAVAEALAERDRRDSERDVAPLRPAADAKLIDTSTATMEEVVDQLVQAITGERNRSEAQIPGGF